MKDLVRVIIVEGLDASGKESLTNTLVNLLETEVNESPVVIKEEFPRYGTRTGETIKRILYGELKDLKPELPKFFEMDRTDYMMKLEDRQIKADVYIFDRYSRSNVYCQNCREDIVEDSKKELDLLIGTISKVNPDKDVQIIEICINYDFTNEDTLEASKELHAVYMGTRETLDEHETASKQLMFAEAMKKSYEVFRKPEYILTLGFDIEVTAKELVDSMGYTLKEYKI